MQLFGVAEVPVDAKPVLAFDPTRLKSAERIVDLARLGYLPEPVLDATWGLGNFWTLYRPDRFVGCDIDPARALHVRCDYNALPFADRCFASCTYDPPFKATHGWGRRGSVHERHGTNGGRNDLITRFGAAPHAYRSIDGGLAECARVTRRFLVVKVQDQQDSGYEWQVGEVVLAAERLGWRMHDQLHQPNSVGQPVDQVQRTARRNYSTYVVLTRRASTVKDNR